VHKQSRDAKNKEGDKEGSEGSLLGREGEEELQAWAYFEQLIRGAAQPK